MLKNKKNLNHKNQSNFNNDSFLNGLEEKQNLFEHYKELNKQKCKTITIQTTIIIITIGFGILCLKTCVSHNTEASVTQYSEILLPPDNE